MSSPLFAIRQRIDNYVGEITISHRERDAARAALVPLQAELAKVRTELAAANARAVALKAEVAAERARADRAEGWLDGIAARAETLPAN